MRRLLMTAAGTAVLMMAAGGSLGARPAETAARPTEIAGQAATLDSVACAVGTVFGSYVRNSLANLAMMGVTVDHATFMAALDSAIRGRYTTFDPPTADRYLTAYIDSRRPRARVDTLSVASQQAWLDSVATLPGAVRRPDGLVFIVLSEGEGPMPTDSDRVEVMYTGRFFDGVEFDHTEQPITFAVADLTPGFAIGLTMMRPGGRYRLAIPASLGYGPDGIPGAIPGNAALDFTVDLIKVIK